jgi:flagellin-like protein
MKSKKGFSEVTGVVVLVLIVVMLIGAFSSFTIIDAGERGVIISASSGVKDEILNEGFHIKTPFVWS